MEAELTEPTPPTGEHAAPTEPETKDRFDRLLEQLEDVDRRAREVIRNHPTTVVVAAVAVGFLIGRILR